ncbi:MAG: hypothetical protein IJN62_04890 [Clostridia bacterium]|nr:hypothetical protein [Clostridia bacterium]
MSDKKTIDKSKIEERKKKRHAKKNRFLIIVILLLVVSTAFTLYMNIDNPLLHNAFSGVGIDLANETVIEFEKTEDYALQGLNGNAIVARNTTVSCVDSNMNNIWTINQNNAAPVIKNGGKYVLTYSFDVPGAMLTKGGDSVEFATENNIIGGSVNKNGYCALITREKGYKAQIVVYSPEGEILYKWHSADNYIIDAAISYDNRTLAVATADFSKNTASGGLMLFNFSQEKPFAGQVLENNIIMQIKFIGKDSLLVVGDIGAAVFNSLGEKKAEYSYSGKSLTNYDIGDDNSLVLALNESDSVLNDTEIKIMGSNLKEKGTYMASGAVSCLDASDGKVLVVSDRKLALVSKRGNELAKLDVNKDIKNAVLMNNGDVLIASGNSAEIVNLQ